MFLNNRAVLPLECVSKGLKVLHKERNKLLNHNKLEDSRPHSLLGLLAHKVLRRVYKLRKQQGNLVCPEKN